MATILERKLHINKPDQEFECERLWQDGTTVALRYVAAGEYTIAGQTVPTGSVTVGIYRQGADYVFWKMTGADGALLGYLVHLCEPTEIRAAAVTYRDLILDIWQSSGEQPILLDEDELSAAEAAGLISHQRAVAVGALAGRLISGFGKIVQDNETVITDATR